MPSASVGYRKAGRDAQVSTVPTPSSPACENASGVLCEKRGLVVHSRGQKIGYRPVKTLSPDHGVVASGRLQHQEGESWLTGTDGSAATYFHVWHAL